jgi:two-component system, cell cycle response regulator
MVPVEDANQTYRTIPKSTLIKLDQKNACLVYIYPTGPNMGSRYVLTPDEFTEIGRTDECQIFNQDASVSRLHARFDMRADGYYVTDLASTNGTYVNNVRVKESRLEDGDSVRVGNCLYRYLERGNLEMVYHEEIYRLTVIDPLTNLHNRRFMTEALEREFSRAQRHKRPLSLVMFDIDRFKQVNDVHGHLAGDFVLRDLAALVNQVIRKDELFCRYGGEEFCIILPETNQTEAVEAAERYRRVVEQHTFMYQEQRLPVTISLGVSAFDSSMTSIEALIDSADTKLYEAKKLGRNCVVC